jgi:hypothetical protein
MRTQAELGEHETGGRLMPAGVRRTLFVVLGLLLSSALYLVAVRGEALLLDLSALSKGMFCF